MSETKKARNASATTTTKKEEAKFSVEEILDSPKAFDTSTYIIAGALHGKGKEFTKKEVTNLTKEFLKQEVK